ncbi:polysaccharide deacetylase [Anaerosporomusa subterranea]|uniref:Polysaccharide deacetylase n=1 Tax=Anaerosporomusa subterranea TaxID=1794912 RepID=A0A154BQM0_ANASB|nr:polysaccharide deacetylase family protein [Anaerosporomusa subterranea]KYZ76313.1 polysaccharide deacetylase [Anaerosporomusa subterranea]
MFETNLRLTSILGLLTVVVVISLFLDYCRLLRRPARIGLWLAILCILAGFALTLQAVLPGNHFYGPVFSEAATQERVVALTFDDGPYPPYTQQTLAVLKENGVPATFFLVGKNAEKHPELVAQIVAEGHQIGNHTYSHTDLLKLDRAQVAAEVDKTQQILATITGHAPEVVRPPHGFRDAVIMDVMAERNLTVVEWSVMCRDWVNPGVEAIASRAVSKVKSGSIILLHDGDGVAANASRAQTIEATRRIIHELKSQGYRFVTVNEILKTTAKEGAKL